MVFGHLPLMPGSCPNPCLLWNYLVSAFDTPWCKPWLAVPSCCGVKRLHEHSAATTALVRAHSQEVLDLLRQSGVVCCTMAGHTHQNGHVHDEWGIHHVVLPAVLETPPGRDCFGEVLVFCDRIELRGVDAMMSLNLPLVASGQASDKLVSALAESFASSVMVS